MKKINFLLAVHCHQPVGNFGWVIEEAYNKAYLPFLNIVESHPKIKLAIHFSGSLLDWLSYNRPEFLKKAKQLVERGQLEILTGGYYEPILSILPERDAISQIKILSDSIRKHFGYEPKGAWLAERVWEPHIVRLLNTSNVLFTILDDTHFRTALNTDSEILNFYITEENGKTLYLFPVSKKLRYSMPFKLPQDNIDFLRNIASEQDESIVFADDIEKFGFWPKTYKWVYEERWLEKFLSLLEQNSDWIRIMSFYEYLNTHRPSARLYIPCASYSEMLEWSGGFFRNFLAKYPEANNMHKRMLYISDKIDSLVQGSRFKVQGSEIEKVRRFLYKAQNNDAYWHGVFGGLYLNHLRDSVYFNLIEAEKALEGLSKKRFPEFEVIDLDADGKEELIARTKDLRFYFSPSVGANLFELDYLKRSINIVNTISRQPEFYHRKLKDIKEDRTNQKTPLSIHDILGVKEKGLEKILIYDQYRKVCLIEHFFSKDTQAKEFFANEYSELGDFTTGDFKFETKKNNIEFTRGGILKLNGALINLDLKKIIALNNKPSFKVLYEIKNDSKVDAETTFAVEFNMSIGCPPFRDIQERVNIKEILLHDEWHNLKLKFRLNKSCSLWTSALETVSESESGLERTLQGMSLLFCWNLTLGQGKVWDVEIETSIL